jgi:hypothetical protein
VIHERVRWLVVALVACSSPKSSPPTNTVPTPAPLVITEADNLGLIGFAPDPGEGWLPKAEAGVFVTTNSAPVIGDVRVVDREGTSVTVSGSQTATLKFGCDENAIIATELGQGAKLAPGLVWILPPGSTWAPVALAIKTTLAADKRLESTGRIEVVSVRTAPAGGTTTITWNGREVLAKPFQRGDMAGAPTTPIDLSTGEPGVPQLVAAWQVGGERGTVLAAFHTATFEGDQVWAVLLDEERGREVESLGFYLYRCAF